VEGEAVELLFAGDVLDGLAGEAALDEGVVVRLLLGREGAVGVGVQGGAGDSEGVEEEKERVAMRVCAQVGGRVELRGGAGESFAESEESCQLSVLSCQL
jgi:hypothetical protein